MQLQSILNLEMQKSTHLDFLGSRVRGSLDQRFFTAVSNSKNAEIGFMNLDVEKIDDREGLFGIWGCVDQKVAQGEKWESDLDARSLENWKNKNFLTTRPLEIPVYPSGRFPKISKKLAPIYLPNDSQISMIAQELQKLENEAV